MFCFVLVSCTALRRTRPRNTAPLNRSSSHNNLPASAPECNEEEVNVEEILIQKAPWLNCCTALELTALPPSLSHRDLSQTATVRHIGWRGMGSEIASARATGHVAQASRALSFEKHGATGVSRLANRPTHGPHATSTPPSLLRKLLTSTAPQLRFARKCAARGIHPTKHR